MTNKMYKNTLFEVNTILKFIDKSLVEKIPQKVRNNIEKNKSNDYIFNYDESKSLHEQEVLKTTEQYLTMLFLRYIASEDEKTEVLKAMNENERTYQEKQREKYNSENLFKNKTQMIKDEKELVNENTSMIKYKEPFFIRVLNRIKKFFGIK